MIEGRSQINHAINDFIHFNAKLEEDKLVIKILDKKIRKKYQGQFNNQTLDPKLKILFDDTENLFSSKSKQKELELPTKEIQSYKQDQVSNVDLEEIKKMRIQINSLKVQLNFCVGKIQQQHQRIQFLQGKHQIQFNINMQQSQKLQFLEKQLNILKKQTNTNDKSYIGMSPMRMLPMGMPSMIMPQMGGKISQMGFCNMSMSQPQINNLNSSLNIPQMPYPNIGKAKNVGFADIPLKIPVSDDDFPSLNNYKKQSKNSSKNEISMNKSLLVGGSSKKIESPIKEKWNVNDSKLKKIANLEKYQEGFNLIVRIISMQNETVKKYNKKSNKCVIGDDTGIASAVIPQSPLVSVGKTVYLKNCGSLIFNYHIQIRIPQNGTVNQSLYALTSSQINMQNNISLKVYHPIDSKELALIGKKKNS